MYTIKPFQFINLQQLLNYLDCMARLKGLREVTIKIARFCFQAKRFAEYLAKFFTHLPYYGFKLPEFKKFTEGTQLIWSPFF